MHPVSNLPATSTLDLSQQEACYHCSLPCAVDTPFQAILGGVNRKFCCAGCQAIAQTIHGQGLEAFYSRRVAMEPPGDDSGLSKISDELLAYDDEVLLNRYAPLVLEDSKTKALDEPKRQVILRLEKIRCAACVWLNEQHWRRVSGVIDVQVNYATQRARILFNPTKCRLSSLLNAARQIGYEAWPFDPSMTTDLAKQEQRRLLFRVGVALLGMMQVMMYAWPTYSNHGDLTFEQSQLMGWAGWFLTLPVIFYSAAPIFQGAWGSIKNLQQTKLIGMDVPVAIALIMAFVAGTLNLVHGSGETYFDSITMFVGFLLLARYVELRARHSAQGGAEALAKQLPATCERLTNREITNAQVHVIPVVKAQVGEYLRVGPGQVIPVDGILLSQEASVSEALLTGESKPVFKKIGSPVFAGSHNVGAPIFIEVEAVGNATRMAGIANLLEEALATKPHIATLAERWAAYFVTVLLGLAILTGLYWQLSGSEGAWVKAVAVLVVSCPCALSLAAPAALAAAQGAMTRIGLLVIKGHALEGLANATDLILDKTGTITSGHMRLVDIHVMNSRYSKAQCLQVAAALEKGQSHPLALALLEAAKDETDYRLAGENYYELGKGVQNGAWRLGSVSWLTKSAMPSYAKPGQSELLLCELDNPVATFILEDEARTGGEELVDVAKAFGMDIHLISGDDQNAVSIWANRYGILHHRAGMLPEDKRQYIQALQKQGRKVIAVGDGINDAPQLGQADVSVAVGQGVPLAQAGADMILVDNSLGVLAKGIRHAHQTKRVIYENLSWAFIYNVTAIPMAMAGWVNPWIAGIGMSLSSLLVTLNAWRLRKI